MKQPMKTLFSGFLVALFSSVVLLTLGSGSSEVRAQAAALALKQVRVLDIEHVFEEEFFVEGDSGLSGVGFPPGAHTLLLLKDSEEGGASLVLVAPPASENGRLTRTPLEIADPVNVAFDTVSSGARGAGLFRLFLLDAEGGELIAVKGGARDVMNPQSIKRFDVQGLGIVNPQGMTLQPDRGMLYILDAEGPSIVRLTPKPGRDFAGASVSVINLPGDLGALRGLAFNPEDDHLYVVSPGQNKLYKLTLSGEVVTAFDFPEAGVPQGMVFAPSLDLTDHPAVFHLYLATDTGRGGEVSEWVLPGSLSPRANFPEG